MDKSTTIELIDFIFESIRLNYVYIVSETVFDICSNELEELENKVLEIKDYLI